MQITLKNLDFSDDVDLREVLKQRLSELDRIVPANANYSTIFLAIGAIEGIFRHLAALFKPQIQALSDQDYPQTDQGKRKRFDKLTIEDLYQVLAKAGSVNLLEDIPNYQHFYQLFRLYRNFVHPQVQLKEKLQVGLGQAQIALGLLNATIQCLDRNLIIGRQVFEKVSGEPRYDSHGILSLPRSDSRHHSFIVMREPVSTKIRLTCDLDFSPNSLINFVFNYADPGDFRMLRLDHRPDEDCPNGVLRSAQKFDWDYELFATPRKLPDKELIHTEMEIDFLNDRFTCAVDGNQCLFENKKDGTIMELFKYAHKDRRIGFFNEVGTVKILRLNIAVG